MQVRSKRARRATALLAVAALAFGLAACGSDDDDAGSDSGAGDKPSGSTASGEFKEASGTVRGFDGSTIKLASIGTAANFPNTGVGVEARVKQFNENDEIPGIKLSYSGLVDDKQDPATALSEWRRLVTQEKIFAITGDVSQFNQDAYAEQQKIPYFGWAFDNTYCSDEPTTDLWGFGIYGCLVPDSPKVMPDQGNKLVEYVREKSGKEKPTLAMFSNDTQSGQNSSKLQAVPYEGAGFDVVMKKGLLPPPPVSDFTPYVQQLLTSDAGNAPDAILCLVSVDCIPVWKLLEANGFKGTYAHNLYSDALLAPMQGTVASINFVAFSETTPPLEAFKKDVAAIDPDQAIDTGVSTGYFSTDMFIEALKTVAEEGKEFITPENVQKAAATQTWKIDGLVGPTRYPDATQKSTPYCNSLVEDTDGTAWKTVVPFSCSEKKYEVK